VSPIATPQLHVPAHFAAAWDAVLLATAPNADHQTLDVTVFVEAAPDATTFHASTKGTYIRARIPTTAPGTAWRAVVRDPTRQVKDVAGQAARRVTGSLFDAELRITNRGPIAEFELFDMAPQLIGCVPVLDVDWPHSIIRIFDSHEPTATSGIDLPLESWLMGAAVARRLKKNMRIDLGSRVGRFTATHPTFPEVEIGGCLALEIAAEGAATATLATAAAAA